MKKANATNQEPKEVVYTYTDSDMQKAEALLKFPINAEMRRDREELANLERQIVSYAEAAERMRQEYKDYLAAVRRYKLRAYKIRKTITPESKATAEEVKRELEAAAKLAWIENVHLEDGYLTVTTRKGMLKTRFNKRIVCLGVPGETTLEYMTEPVVHEMPQYHIRITLSALGETMTQNARSLVIRLADKEDYSHFKGNDIVVHQSYCHWASNGELRREAWQYLCLGEYADDIQNAATKGLVPLLSELAVYLQNSGDEGNAYRTKHIWALALGKKEYNEFIFRTISEGETREEIEERYRRDYKTLNQPAHGGEVIDGTHIAPGSTRMAEPGGITDEQMQVALQGIRTTTGTELRFFDTLPTFNMIYTPAVAITDDNDDEEELDCDDGCDGGDDCENDDCECPCH